LIAVGLGCDVSLHSIISPRELLTFLQSPMVKDVSNEDAYLAIKKLYIKKYNRTDKRAKKDFKTKGIVSDNIIETSSFSKMIDIFTNAFVYEPTNITTMTNEFTYIHQPPPNNKIHPYLKEFVSNDTTTEEESNTDVVDCCQCVGTGAGSHHFLEAEGLCGCDDCGKICCLECIFKKETTCESKFCYNCFLPHVSVSDSQMEHTLTANQMREELKKFGVQTKASEEDDE
jgi:hypothetical protein